MPAYFKKEIVSSPFYVGDRALPFIHVGDDEGVLETENENLIRLLRSASDRRIGGIIEIPEWEFDELKKKPVVSRQQPQQRLHAVQPLELPKPQVGVPSASPTAQPAAGADPKPVDRPRVSDIAENRPRARKIK